MISVRASRLVWRVVVGRETRIGQQVRPADRADELVPELVGHAHDEQPAVGGRKGLHRRHRIMRAAALALRDVPFVEIPGGGVSELMQRDIEQAGIDVTALAGRTCLDDSGQ